MKKTLAPVILGCAIVAGASSAHAGFKMTGGVSINNSNRAAGGSLRSAANSSNSVEYVFCTTYSGTNYVWCEAKDASGAVAYCSATNAALSTALTGMSGDVGLTFFWDAARTCTRIDIVTGSAYR